MPIFDDIFTTVANVSVLLLPILLIVAVRRRFIARPIVSSVILGVVFTLIGLVVMQNAVQFIPGIRTDPRGAVVVLSALFAGPIAAFLTGGCLAIARFTQGGLGAIPGAAYIVVLALVSSLCWIWLDLRAARRITPRHALIFASLAALVPPITLLFLSKAPWDVYLMSTSLSAVANFCSVLLIATLLIYDDDRAAAILERNERAAQIRALAENAPAVLFQVSVSGIGHFYLHYCSMASELILGYPPQTLIGPRGKFFSVFGETEKITLKSMLEVTTSEQKTQTQEIPYTHPDGTPMWLRIDLGARQDAHGAWVWNGTIFDVTRHHAAEETKDNFLSVVSHELRTPLTSIRGSLGLVLAQSDQGLPPQIHRMLCIAERNAERLVHLVNDILDLQKIRSGHMDLDLKKQPVSPVLKNAVQSINEFMPEKKITIQVNDEVAGTQAVIDLRLLMQIMQNLLSNAVKFAPVGSQVVVSTSIEEGMLRISVSDQGPGVPDSFHDFIFDRFQQAQSTLDRKVGGTGLGLNISRTFVEAMEGKIWYESTAGAGAVFHVALPLAVRQEDSIPSSKISEIGERSGHRSFAESVGNDRLLTSVPSAEQYDGTDGSHENGPTVLYAERDENLRDIIAGGFKGKARVLFAGSCGELECVLAENDVDIILTDLEFPDGAQAEVLNAIPPNIPVVTFSAAEAGVEARARFESCLIKSQVSEDQIAALVLQKIAFRNDGKSIDAA